MAFSVNPLTFIISIPKTDLTLVSGTLYSMDTNVFRLALKNWEASEEGITQTKTHNHNTEAVIVGITYARAVNVLAPYSIEFEDGQYSVILVGSNNNIWDIESGILIQNQVQVIPTNSAGLQIVTQGSGVSDQDKTDIITGVWAHIDAETIRKLLDNKVTRAGDIITIYEDNGTTVWKQIDLASGGRVEV